VEPMLTELVKTTTIMYYVLLLPSRLIRPRPIDCDREPE